MTSRQASSSSKQDSHTCDLRNLVNLFTLDFLERLLIRILASAESNDTISEGFFAALKVLLDWIRAKGLSEYDLPACRSHLAWDRVIYPII